MKNNKQQLIDAFIQETTILLAVLMVINQRGKKSKELEGDYLKMLKKALKKAEDSEDFETCIDLNNKIKAIENGTTGTAN